MKIVLFARGLWNRAGIERMIVALSNSLCKHYEVIIVVIEPFNKDLAPYSINEGISIISLDSYFKAFNVKNIIVLRRLIKKLKPDLLITVATPLVRISAPALFGLNVRNISWEHFNLYAGSKIGAFWKWISTFLVEKTVVLCDTDARNFRKVKARNVVTIPNFSTIGTENEASSCESKILLAVGRHAEQKGYDMLIKAWAKVDRTDWKLKIVGSGKLYEQNIKLAESLNVKDYIIFQESTSDIVSEYRNASCFVLSSRYEGLVMVLIEARMMGLTCVSFDCETGPREIIRDKVDGFLVPPGDIDALAEKLSEVLALGNLKEYALLAREDAMSRYGEDAVVGRWIELITSVKNK